MKALLTAEVSQEAKELEALLEIVYAGWYKDGVILTEEQMSNLVAAHNVDIIITSYDPITRKVIDSSPNLKLIVCTRSNPVNIDAEYAAKKNILVSYAPGRNSICTAEYTVAMMLSITRKIPMAYAALKSGKHTKDIEENNKTKPVEGLRRDVTWSLGIDTPYVLYKGNQLYKKTLGIVGYGTIGQRVGQLCKAFGMNILAYDPYKSTSEDGAIFTSTLKELAEQSDIITVHCKDTPQTYHIIDESVFKSMKRTAFFINTSRGAIVDENALINALLNDEIAGAALDVFDEEPIPKDHPFITKCNNVVITPHLAGATYEAIENHTEQLLTDIKHFLNHEPLEYEYKV
ncbi:MULTISPECIES: 2-hydroxyacid dehydrogenase [Tepidanaerobacter]|uniref:2-hydroxyacid dehydrogenase n=1 Tax=Tepidanaerobacter TaxID=499228 RepID=UPI000A728B33|nr:2-hydroxyacid dehydrogenase [Tepidanaerobacter sp. EBM-49]